MTFGGGYFGQGYFGGSGTPEQTALALHEVHITIHRFGLVTSSTAFPILAGVAATSKDATVAATSKRASIAATSKRASVAATTKRASVSHTSDGTVEWLTSP